MSSSGWLFLIGSLFVVVGCGFFYWGVREMRAYLLALVSRYDLREFMMRTPKRPEPGALKIGGVICWVVAFWCIVAGFIFR